MKDEYEMTYTCSNCNKIFPWYFKFGTIAKQPECPHCGVHPSDLKQMPYVYKGD